MKQTIILAAVAVAFMFSSCQTEEVMPGQNSQSDELVFTASIVDQATRTTVDTNSASADKGKVSWEVDDEISVSDGTNTAVYYIKDTSDIAADGSAAFTYKSGTRPSKDATSYSATYGNAITTAQTYSATAGKLPMTGVSDSANKTKLNFSVTCGLLKLNLTASGDNAKDISKIEIVGTPTGGSASVYTLTCDNVSIASATDFYIALPAGSYNLMKFTNSKGCVCFKKAKTAMEITANNIKPVTLTGITFSALLPGKFTVNSSSKQVQFSTANLWCNASASPVTYSFESAQNAYPSSWDASHVGHFFWTKEAANSYAASYSDGTNAITDIPFFAESKGGLTVDGQGGLYALTGGDSGEWIYLINSRTDASSLYKYGVSVTTSAGTVQNCVVIAPDNYSGTIATSYSAAEWAAAESSGLVCLPAAGYHYGSLLRNGGSSGLYWSATPNAGNKDHAYRLSFNGSDVSPVVSGVRARGYSVRLVCSVSK